MKILFSGKESLKAKVWHLEDYDEFEAKHIEQNYKIPLSFSRVLTSRGINSDNIDLFLNGKLNSSLPDPYVLKGMEKLIKKIIDLITTNSKIAIFGDYDVDGATSTALLINYFKKIGLDVLFHIPDRDKEGYGPNKEAVGALFSKGIDFLLCVDCGTSSKDVFKNFNCRKIGVIDHHILEHEPPNIHSFINPNRMDDNSGLNNLCAAGLVFCFLVALNRALRNEGFFKNKREPNLINYLDLVALGTVCDVMPLTGLNRVFVKQGLIVCSKRTNVGIKEIADISDITEKISSADLGFKIGPKINASGRIGISSIGTEILSTDSISKAKELASYLKLINEERKNIEKKSLDVAKKQLDDAFWKDKMFMVVSSNNWPSGVIGLIASRLKDEINKPVFCITYDETGIGKGSARSINGIDIGAIVIFAKQKGLLIKAGGHKMAAGFSIEKEKQKEFIEFIDVRIRDFYKVKKIENVLHIDSFLPLISVNKFLIKQKNKLSPFGMGNREPIFAIFDVYADFVKIVGNDHISFVIKRTDTEKTLKVILFKAVGTKIGDFLLKKQKILISISGRLQINNWRGYENIQMICEDIFINDK